MREKIIQKALNDPKFREELKKNAVAAVEKEAGVKVPSGTTIKVLEDSASTVHLVLPPAQLKGALSDKDLAKVSGGAFTQCLDESSNYRSGINSK
jgi:hypothetical protein